MIHMSLIIMLTFVISGYVSYRTNVSLFTEEISKQFTKANEQAAARLDLQLRDIYRISNFIVFHPYIEQVVRRSGESEVRESHTQITDQTELNELLYQIKNDENKLYSMFLYDRKDNSFFFTVSPSAESSLSKETYEDIKERLAGSSGNLIWFPLRLRSAVEASGYRNFFAAARYMKNKDFDQYGTMVMLFDESLFAEDLKELVSDEQANVFLFDRQDRLVYTDERGGEPDSIPVPGRMEAQEIVTDHGTSYLYVKSRSNQMDFALISRVALDSLQEKSSVIFKISVLIGSIGVLLAAALISWSGRRLFRPLRELVQGMRRMREGNMETRVAVQTGDELAYIGQSFNSMAENLGLLIREVYERQLNEREAELTALQTQLNPHFLHNTLDTIYWKLYLQDDRDTAKLVVSLSDMLRYALEPAATETELHEEMAQIRNYLTIQNSRHGEGLETIIQMEEGTEQARVPRLILQPLVENAFVHAFADQLQARVLIIKAAYGQASSPGMESDPQPALIIEIIDNGKGMEEAEIERIISSAIAPRSDCKQEKGPVVGRKRIHIGIRSVIRRLNLLYGEPYGVRIISKPGAGTTIRLLLPLEQREA
jgi:two-component system sensor histidine kinase YesM